MGSLYINSCFIYRVPLGVTRWRGSRVQYFDEHPNAKANRTPKVALSENAHVKRTTSAIVFILAPHPRGGWAASRRAGGKRAVTTAAYGMGPFNDHLRCGIGMGGTSRSPSANGACNFCGRNRRGRTKPRYTIHGCLAGWWSG